MPIPDLTSSLLYFSLSEYCQYRFRTPPPKTIVIFTFVYSYIKAKTHTNIYIYIYIYYYRRERKRERETEMGLVGGEENGNGERVGEVHIGSKNKYKRMDSDFVEEDLALYNDGMEMTRKNSNSKKFVFLCAIFASLNSVLLGYGLSFLSVTFSIWSNFDLVDH